MSIFSYEGGTRDVHTEVRVPPGTPCILLRQTRGSRCADSPAPAGSVREVVDSRVDEVFDLLEIVGEGAYSSVCKGEHILSKERVAVKVIDKSKIVTPKLRWRLHNEFNVNRLCLGHPNLVQLLEVWESDEDACLVMELCSGRELFERVVERGLDGFSEVEAAHVMRQLGSAVCHLHSRGVVHRDIKPENILFASEVGDVLNETIKLTDFGLAKLIDLRSIGGAEGFQAVAAGRLERARGSLKASMSGTPAYCAPERLDVEEQFETFAVDLWSLGCICFFLLCGRPPFFSSIDEDDALHDYEIADMVFRNDIVFPEQISPLAEDFVRSLLTNDPMARATAQEMMGHPWLQATATDVSSASPASYARSASIPIAVPGARDSLKSSMNWVIESQIERSAPFTPRSMDDGTATIFN